MRTEKIVIMKYQMGMTFVNWTRGYSYYFMAQRLSVFCTCPETLNEAEFKSDRLIEVEEEILKERYGCGMVTASYF
jgi:hypothetical protein